jgi:hypothetical protein
MTKMPSRNKYKHTHLPVRNFSRFSTSAQIVTLVSAIVIVVLLLGEFFDYRSVHVESSLIVDGGRKAKMVIDFDISFPKIPCYSTSSGKLLSFSMICCCSVYLPDN